MVDAHAAAAPWLWLAYAAGVGGFGWLALAMEAHWQQVRGSAPPGRRARHALRGLGVVALGLSLAACLQADHATMALLVWVMLLAAAALTVSFVLTWRPALLRPLACGAGRARQRPSAAR